MKKRLKRKRWKNELRQAMFNTFVDGIPFTKREIMKMSINEMSHHLYQEWFGRIRV
jgi:hypothetical protein